MTSRGATAGDGARTGLVICAALVVLGLVLRMPSLGNSLFGDELSTYSIVTGHRLGSIVNALNGHSVETNPPLYFLLAWFAERLGSAPELLRLFSLLAGVATIALTYRFGLRTVGRRAAGTAALLSALSPFLIFYSTEARGYAVVMYLTLASGLALLRAMDRNRAGDWIAYGLLSCAAMYTHYTAVFPLVAQLAWGLVTHRDRWRGLIAANAAAAVSFGPWLPALSKNTSSFGTKVFGIIEPFRAAAVAHDVAHAAIGHPYLTLSAEPGATAIVLILGGCALAAGIGLREFLRARGGRLPAISASGVLPVALALATPVGLALYSALGQSAWDMRNLITAWPAFALLLGALLTAPRGRLAAVTVAVTVAGFAIGAGKLLSSSDQRPDYAAAAQLALREGDRPDPVALIQAPTPGPYAAMDAAFAYAGDPGRPLLRVGAAPIQTVLSAPPYALLSATPSASLAAQTAAAGGDGKVFVVAPGSASVAQLLGTRAVDVPKALGATFGTGTTGALLGTVFTPLSAYLRAIRPRFAPVQTIRLPGFLRLSVYVFRRR